MNIQLQSLLRLKPITVGAALFSLMWFVVKESSLPIVPHGELCCYVEPGLYYDQIFFSFLLVVASMASLLKRIWSQTVAVILSSFVLFEYLFRAFLVLARSAEVPRFSYQHFSLWWPNLDEWQILLIVLAGVILSCSAMSVVRLIGSRKIKF